jgi:hypothetical protein
MVAVGSWAGILHAARIRMRKMTGSWADFMEGIIVQSEKWGKYNDLNFRQT